VKVILHHSIMTSSMDAVISLLIQIPLVGIFIWFILERDKRGDAALAARESQWQMFLREQREQNNQALARLAEELKSMSVEVTRMNGTLTAHDVASKTLRNTGSLRET